MEEYGEENSQESFIEQEGLSSEEKGFMQGYLDDDKAPECSECGGALNDEKNVVKKNIDDEEQLFCSKICSEEFEESI